MCYKQTFSATHASRLARRQKGNVIDPTWNEEADYMGIRFSSKQLSEIICLTGQYGVFDSLWMFPEAVDLIQSWFPCIE